MAEEIALARINAAIAALGNLQIGIEPTDDLDLTFKMLGYKDSDSNPIKVLAKDKNARVDNITMQALIGVGDRYIGVDSNGKAKIMADPNNATDEFVKVTVDDTTPKYLQDTFTETSSIKADLLGAAGTNQTLGLRVKLDEAAGNIATIAPGGTGGVRVEASPDEKVKVLAQDSLSGDLVSGLNVNTATNALKRIVTVNPTASSMDFDIQGADIATPGQVFQKKANGEFGFQDVVPVDVVRRELLSAHSLAPSQLPSGLDVPLIVEFGAAQTPTHGLFSIDVTGVITCLQPFIAVASVLLQYGRSGSAGTANLFARGMYQPNGGSAVQFGPAVRSTIDAADTLIPSEFDVNISLTTGDKFWIEFVRASDNGGNNSGGLYDGDPVLTGWEASSCAQLSIFDYVATGEGVQVAVQATDHNDLSNIQGGNSTERYHLTQAEATSVQNLVTDYVTTATNQTVTGDKIWGGMQEFQQGLYISQGYTTGAFNGASLVLQSGSWVRPATDQGGWYLTNGTDPSSLNTSIHMLNTGLLLNSGNGTNNFGQLDMMSTGHLWHFKSGGLVKDFISIGDNDIQLQLDAGGGITMDSTTFNWFDQLGNTIRQDSNGLTFTGLNGKYKFNAMQADATPVKAVGTNANNELVQFDVPTGGGGTNTNRVTYGADISLSTNTIIPPVSGGTNWSNAMGYSTGANAKQLSRLAASIKKFITNGGGSVTLRVSYIATPANNQYGATQGTTITEQVITLPNTLGAERWYIGIDNAVAASIPANSAIFVEIKSQNAQSVNGIIVMLEFEP